MEATLLNRQDVNNPINIQVSDPAFGEGNPNAGRNDPNSNFQEDLQRLVDMGFPRDHAERAL